jgi:DNA polymerase-3 subunit gamma/tau
MLDELLSFSSGRLTSDEIGSGLGLIEHEALFGLVDAVIRKDAKAALNGLNTIIEQGKDTGVLLAALIEHYRNLMVAKVAGADEQLLDVPQEECVELVAQAGKLSLEYIVVGFNAMVNARELSKRLDSIRIPLEIALAKLTQPKGAVPQQAPSRPETSKGEVQPPQQPVQPQARATQPPPQAQPHAVKRDPETRSHHESSLPQQEDKQAPSLSLDDIKEVWPRLI